MSKRYKIICPLDNLQISNVLVGRSDLSNEEKLNLLRNREIEIIEGIDLFDGVKIRRISEDDLKDLKNSIVPFSSRIIFSPHMFVLEKHLITEDSHDFQVDQTMRNIILALRLFKKGHVLSNCIFYILVSEKRERFVSIDSSCEGSNQSYELWLSDKYVLYFDEFPLLRTLIEIIQRTDFNKYKRLNLACKRFQRAYKEVDFEDQLIDFMIAFEALFVRKDFQGSSKSEKIANGCSSLLGKTIEEKDNIVSFMSKASHIRNLIVHGAEYKTKELHEWPGIVFKTECYLRDSIKILLKQFVNF